LTAPSSRGFTRGIDGGVPDLNSPFDSTFRAI
jgi:hypothetical protein